MRSTRYSSSFSLFAVGLGFLLTTSSSLAADDKGEWSTFKGQIVWGDKTPPKVEALKVDKDQDHCLKNGPLTKDEFVVNKDNLGVKNVFVWLIPTDPTKKADSIPVHPSLKEPKEKQLVLDQPCCQFVPHVIALRKGQELLVKNSAPVNHNVNYQGGPDNPGDNPILPAGKSITIKDLKPSRTPISVSCGIHGWMKGWIRVFDHPYYAVTDADGKFEMKNAPAGDFRVVIWHEGVGWVKGGKNGTPITIKAGTDTNLGKVEMTPPKD